MSSTKVMDSFEFREQRSELVQSQRVRAVRRERVQVFVHFYKDRRPPLPSPPRRGERLNELGLPARGRSRCAGQLHAVRRIENHRHIQAAA